MNGASSEPAVNASFLPLRSAGLLMPLSAGTSRPMSFLRTKPAMPLTGSPFERAIAIGACDAWPMSYSPLPTICTVVTEPLPSSTRDLEAVLGEQPFLDGEMDGGVRGPGRPIEPHLELVGGERGSAGERGNGKGCSERENGAQLAARRHREALPFMAVLISKSEMKV